MTEQIHVSSDPTPSDLSVGQLVAKLSEQTSQLVHDELRLARVEMSAKARRAGMAAGLFGGTGLFAVFGLGALVTSAILGLAVVLPGWTSALIIGVALLAIAGLSGLMGRHEVKRATPPMPEQALRSVKQDVAAFRSHGGRS